MRLWWQSATVPHREKPISWLQIPSRNTRTWAYKKSLSVRQEPLCTLAELVKVDPKAIGVGQYQHDVNQIDLASSLDAVVEDCVNAVGVDINTASAELLTHVSGLTTTLAENIISYRDDIGRFKARSELKKVPRLGPKAFEQCAGFLRIMDGSNALDASAVHPEAYPVVKKIAADTGRDIRKLIGDTSELKSSDCQQCRIF